MIDKLPKRPDLIAAQFPEDDENVRPADMLNLLIDKLIGKVNELVDAVNALQ